MITVTDSAINGLNEHFSGKDVQPIRVYLADGGCGGMKLTLAVDENRDGDKSHEQESLTFLINEELSEKAGTVTIDMGEYGFSIESENSLGGGGGCSGCSCGC